MKNNWHNMLMAALALAGCAEMDLHGKDPIEYYSKDGRRIENTVKSLKASHTVRFATGETKLAQGQAEDLTEALAEVEPASAERVMITVAPSEMTDGARRKSLSKLFIRMGYAKRAISFEPSDAMSADEAQIDVTYAVVVPPAICPDWRTSPITTFSNTRQGNIGCATTINLGQQVADPNDLKRGRGEQGADSERNSISVRQYRSGQKVGDAEGGEADADAINSAVSGVSGAATGQ